MLSSVVGIDPGKDGGIAWITPDSIGAAAMPAIGEGKRRQLMPIEIRDIIKNAAPELVVIEQQSTRPNENAGRALVIGDNFGLLKGIVIGLGIELAVVRPQKWKQRIFPGTAVRDKAAAIAFCNTYFPDIPLLTSAGKGSKKPHDGIADAICIAEFGRRAYSLAG